MSLLEGIIAIDCIECGNFKPTFVHGDVSTVQYCNNLLSNMLVFQIADLHWSSFNLVI